MTGIAAFQGVVDTIDYFSASRSFDPADVNVAVVMQELQEHFLKAFAEGHQTHPFHGSRSSPNITPNQRQAIAATANGLYGIDIWWTWEDMLDYNDWSWNGEPESIDETRCDGVVEYCYERNNVHVCGGKNGNRWNIASPSTNNVENHNDFHNGDYNQGELCPRIQAGDQGNDTTFVQLPANPPAVSHFDIKAFSLQGAPTISFTILSDMYEYVYLRITVSKDGNSPKYIFTENPDGSVGHEDLSDYWKVKKVYTNKQYVLFWAGKTEDGPDYYGRNGIFNFRIVAIDAGGNVSEQQSIDIHIEWPLYSSAAIPNFFISAFIPSICLSF